MSRTLSALTLSALTLSALTLSAPYPCFARSPSASTPPTLPERDLESADAQWFVAQVNRGLRAVWVAEIEAAWRNAIDITPAHERVIACSAI